jgi:hypothetical protein
MKEDIRHIEDEIMTWQRDNCNVEHLDALKKEETIVLRYKYGQINDLEKYIKKVNHNPTYIEPGNITLLKKAIRRELRIRHWYWPIVNFCTPVSFIRWWVGFFRSEVLLDANKNFGLRTGLFLKSNRSWWQKDLFEIISIPSLHAKWSDMKTLTRGMFIMTAIMLILALFTFLGFNILKNQDSSGPSNTTTTKSQLKTVSP